MPNQNGTGPQGQGAGTGRRLGLCRAKKTDTNQTIANKPPVAGPNQEHGLGPCDNGGVCGSARGGCFGGRGGR